MRLRIAVVPFGREKANFPRRSRPDARIAGDNPATHLVHTFICHLLRPRKEGLQNVAGDGPSESKEQDQERDAVSDEKRNRERLQADDYHVLKRVGASISVTMHTHRTCLVRYREEGWLREYLKE